MKDSTWFDAVTLLLIALMSIAAGVPGHAGVAQGIAAVDHAQ
jgi:uncharacterized membrane protein YtjA (UPF0391 family)